MEDDSGIHGNYEHYGVILVILIIPKVWPPWGRFIVNILKSPRKVYHNKKISQLTPPLTPPSKHILTFDVYAHVAHVSSYASKCRRV